MKIEQSLSWQSILAQLFMSGIFLDPNAQNPNWGEGRGVRTW